MSKNVAEPERLDSCWINKATRAQTPARVPAPTPAPKHTYALTHARAQTHKNIAFPLQQLFTERAPVLRYKYIACLVTCTDDNMYIAAAAKIIVMWLRTNTRKFTNLSPWRFGNFSTTPVVRVSVNILQQGIPWVWTGAENLAPIGFEPRAIQPVASRRNFIIFSKFFG